MSKCKTWFQSPWLGWTGCKAFTETNVIRNQIDIRRPWLKPLKLGIHIHPYNYAYIYIHISPAKNRWWKPHHVFQGSNHRLWPCGRASGLWCCDTGDWDRNVWNKWWYSGDIMWVVGKTIINHPRVISIFIGGMEIPFPVIFVVNMTLFYPHQPSLSISIHH